MFFFFFWVYIKKYFFIETKKNILKSSIQHNRVEIENWIQGVLFSNSPFIFIKKKNDTTLNKVIKQQFLTTSRPFFGKLRALHY